MSKLIRINEVEERTGYKRSSLYAMMADGRFVKNIKIGPNRVVWDEEEVDQWIKDRISESREEK